MQEVCQGCDLLSYDERQISGEKRGRGLVSSDGGGFMDR